MQNMRLKGPVSESLVSLEILLLSQNSFDWCHILKSFLFVHPLQLDVF